jgi:hypothetical protein
LFLFEEEEQLLQMVEVEEELKRNKRKKIRMVIN